MNGEGPHRPPPRGRLLFRVRRSLDRRGATATEFALVAIPFFTTIIILMETCWQLATGAALDHASLKASRFGATGSSEMPSWQRRDTPEDELPATRADAIKWLVRQSTGGLIRSDPSLLRVTTRSFRSLGGMAGTPDETAGGSDAIVEYTIRYTQPFISGGLAASFWGGTGITHETTIVVRNEPFENAGGTGG